MPLNTRVPKSNKQNGIPILIVLQMPSKDFKIPKYLYLKINYKRLMKNERAKRYLKSKPIRLM